MLVIMEGLWLKTGKDLYHQMARFWTKVFALTFAIGVATGIVMEFEFGTNWATYSRYVGDVFGSALAAEGIFAFFLESGFLAVLLFGWDRVSRKVHFFATCMVCLGAHFSAIWIVVANSWMQTPGGLPHRGRGAEGSGGDHRLLADGLQPLVHGPAAARAVRGVAGGGVPGGERQRLVSAEEAHTTSSRAPRCGSGWSWAWRPRCCNWSAATTARWAWRRTSRPSWRPSRASTTPRPTRPCTLFGWVDEKAEKVKGDVAIPGLLSYLVYSDTSKPVQGLHEFKPEDRPPVNVVLPVLSHHGGGGLRDDCRGGAGVPLLLARVALREALAALAAGLLGAGAANRQPRRLVRRRGRAPAVDRLRPAAHAGRGCPRW